MNAYDVIVVGGGVVGLTAALGLANKTNCRIAVIDRQPLNVEEQAASIPSRVSAITKISQNILQKLNVWSHLPSQSISGFNTIKVYHDSEELIFLSKEINQENLGHIVSDANLRACCFNELETCLNVTLLGETELAELHLSDDCVVLKDTNENEYRAKILVAADGANSWVRQVAQFDVEQSPYHHSALVTTMQTELPHQHTAHQRFIQSGPLAFLPLNDQHQSSIVWSSSHNHIRELQLMSDEEFNKTIQLAFGDALGAISIVPSCKRLTFPLQKSHAKHYIKNRIALVGDAAHTIHPLAGQGVNMGILDAAALVDVISTAKSCKRDIGSVHTLRKYERWRKLDNALMLAAIDGIKYFFQTEHSAVSAVRKVGLVVTRRSTTVKKIFMWLADGKRGDLPRLAMINEE